MTDKNDPLKKFGEYPVLALRDIVVFPRMIVPLFVGRDRSVKALEAAMADNKQILLVTQRYPSVDEPLTTDLYQVGTLATVLQMLKLPDNTVKVLVEGSHRARVNHYNGEEPFFKAHIEVLVEDETPNPQLEALARSVMVQFEHYVKLNKKVSPDISLAIAQLDEPARIADTVAAHIGLKIEDKQELLEKSSIQERLESLYTYMEAEIGVLNIEKKIRNRVKRQMEKSQKEYYLNEQMKAIQRELGEGGETGRDEMSELEAKIKAAALPKDAHEKAMGELKKLRSMSPMSSESSVVRNYLDWIISIPWHKKTKTKRDIKAAQKILDTEHFGLEKVKERIIEYLAVQAKVGKLKGPILCLVGAPGVGKTSLGKSIAKATGRNFVRMSLGGVRDEAEIRGHRRTYIGSMPGKIIQNMKKAKTNNPLFLLDEIDKLGNDWRGDPTSALLEVLDPEQNKTFNDHYMELDYDLSDVMFITTANSLNMPQPLLDRMEIIRVAGYTEQDKIEIAKRHLVPKILPEHGLKAADWSITTEAIRLIIQKYTREAGVRNLERELSKLCRKAVREMMVDKATKIKVTEKNLGKYLGIERFHYGEVESVDMVGITTGLAWTEVGGEILSIEAAVVPGTGKMIITGKLGDVMQESVQAAASYVRARAAQFGIPRKTFERRDIHVHVPEGAMPKDGPSAGVAMCTSIVSALTGIPIRRDVAMTGEITLRGRVLAIGGLKEKLLAALRSGIKEVCIPEENLKDLAEIPDVVKNELIITPASNVDQVLKVALKRSFKPIKEADDINTPVEKIVVPKAKRARPTARPH